MVTKARIERSQIVFAQQIFLNIMNMNMMKIEALKSSLFPLDTTVHSIYIKNNFKSILLFQCKLSRHFMQGICS